jgi:hypothetical protein
MHKGDKVQIGKFEGVVTNVYKQTPIVKIPDGSKIKVGQTTNEIEGKKWVVTKIGIHDWETYVDLSLAPETTPAKKTTEIYVQGDYELGEIFEQGGKRYQVFKLDKKDISYGDGDYMAVGAWAKPTRKRESDDAKYNRQWQEAHKSEEEWL